MDSVTRAASAALQDVLDTIDSQLISTTTSTGTGGRLGPESLTSNLTQTIPPDDDRAARKENNKEVTRISKDSNSVDQASQIALKCKNGASKQSPSQSAKTRDWENEKDKPVWSLSLRYEEERWTQLRNQIAELPLFKKYFIRMAYSSWSIDEAFTSFCLDQIEDILAKSKSSTPPQPKKGTRRKGQPKKYDRKQIIPKENSPARQSRKRQCRDNSLKFNDMEELSEDEDDNFLAMEDNPKDLDYEPDPMIPFPMQRKSLPRSAIMAQVPTGIPTTRQEQKSPKRTPRTPQKSPKVEPINPPDDPVPSKRGRPRKTPTEVKKKETKPRVKPEKPRNYIRMELRLQRLPKMYGCKMCSEQFPEVEDIRKHFQEVHQRSTPNQNGSNLLAEGDSLDSDIAQISTLLRQCRKCKKFVENMTVHRREHQERAICEECGKGFTDTHTLRKHKKVHELDRTGHRYKCELCDKSYRFVQNLRIHVLCHGDEKTFICDHCGKSFYNSNRLMIHSAIHLKEKPFKCKECGRGFSQKNNMQKHERVHTGLKPYQCEICLESFNHKVSLKNHKKRHHGIDWWKEVSRPEPVATRRSKDTGSQGLIPNRSQDATTDQIKPNTANPVTSTTQLTSRDRAPQSKTNQTHQIDPIPSEATWHPEEENIPHQHQTHTADKAVHLQPLPQAGNQWKSSLDRQEQAGGDQGMAAFLYPSTYLQGYPSGYSGTGL